MSAHEPIYLTDLGLSQPQLALSTDRRKYHWQVVPYETEEFSGKMLIAGPETEAPPVAVPLGVSGWHRIFLGLWSNWTEELVRVRLSGDSAFVKVNREREQGSFADNYSLDERYWKTADLTGQDLVIGQQTAGMTQPAYVAYVKLEPLDEGEVAELLADRNEVRNRRLICMNDGFSDFGRFRPTSQEEIWEFLEPFRDTDFQKMFWCPGAGGDVLTYPSDIGSLTGSKTRDYPRVVDRYIGESMQILAGAGIDTVETVVEYGHSVGLEVHISQRMEAFQCCPPFEDYFTGDFYRDHPEWRCVDIDGREIARMSYAFPEVRELLLAVFRELATRYDIDGVNPIFNRGAPFLLYESPLVEGFREETGLDATQLAEDDERYLRYRAGVMTEFMAELRREMDEIGARRGRPLEISAHALNDAATNLFYGLDIPAWVEGGLIDNLISYPWRDEEIDVDYFGKLTAGSPVQYYPEIMPRTMPAEDFRQRALQYYAAGADGLCFWDTNGRHQRFKEWSMIRRLGHRDSLEGWNDGEGELYRTVPLRSVGGYVLDKYPPHWAY
ncbi:MAG: family 10 glycosylhydrolase [Caldilineaceae bacterium SB0675_bin_29]|uniref:Family 10 glycosylhydrolase n=1 Tax=Caldilineaceae bacterium SB0675_bin_29 TaxID=2605266 RepID=A0A6B1FXA8_9CHLR|nr:family 10 glycosylhydrolase [Caldilineaceae bacterium SB0675_bin_29]